MDTAADTKKTFLRPHAAAVLLLVTLGVYGTGRAAVFDHLLWGQILQGDLYDDPAYETPLYVFQLQVETDASVDSVEFLTPAGYWDFIPNDESTYSEEIETYHWTYDATHVWEYWGYFIDPDIVAEFYGDGEYVVLLHYTDGSEEETTVWYGVPGTAQAIAPPTQQPSITWPPYDGVVASPVVFDWDPVTDANVWDVVVNVFDPNGGYVLSDIYDANAIASDPCGLPEGSYEAEVSFENFYPITNPDGIPFDLLKSTRVLHPFEVVYGTVYRFRSLATNHHYYTIDEAEKNRLIEDHSQVRIFEGPAFHAWTTKYFSDLTPVYRFWSGLSRSHFYTAREAEKDLLVANYPHFWTYEGVAFYAYPEGRQPLDAAPVYRFWNPSDNSHRFTIDRQEAERLMAERPQRFLFEGIAFYVYE